MNDGHSLCGIFVTHRYLNKSKHVDQVSSCMRKTNMLLKRYNDLVEPSHQSDFPKLRDNTPVENPFEQSPKEQIDEFLSRLTPREQQMLKLRFGLEGQRRTLEEVGEEFGLTTERIRQIQDKALRRIRDYIRYDCRRTKEGLGK